MRALLPVLLLAAPAGAAQSPARIAITTGAKAGAIMLRAPRLHADYRITLSTWDPATERLASGAFRGGWVNFEVTAQSAAVPSQNIFVIAPAKPGRYVLQVITQQNYWGLCYGGSTFAVTVAPGQVVYLGELDGASLLADLRAKVTTAGEAVSRNGRRFFYFDGAPVRLAAPTADALAAAAAWLKQASPGTSVGPVAAAPVPARFDTGRSLTGEPICQVGM